MGEQHRRALIGVHRQGIDRKSAWPLGLSIDFPSPPSCRPFKVEFTTSSSRYGSRISSTRSQSNDPLPYSIIGYCCSVTHTHSPSCYSIFRWRLPKTCRSRASLHSLRSHSTIELHIKQYFIQLIVNYCCDVPPEKMHYIFQ
jgi:hypothetical protein